MSEWRFKLLYDGGCPMCVREVKWLQFWNRRGLLAFEDISAAGFDPARYGTSKDELMQAMHGIYPDGRMVRALEAFREAYRLVALACPLPPPPPPNPPPLSHSLSRSF